MIGGVILAALLVGQLKLTNGDVPMVENEFHFLTNGDSAVYGQVLQPMLVQVMAKNDGRT